MPNIKLKCAKNKAYAIEIISAYFYCKLVSEKSVCIKKNSSTPLGIALSHYCYLPELSL